MPRWVEGFLRSFFFFFNDTATTEIYTLSLHDALPILRDHWDDLQPFASIYARRRRGVRSEEHTSELQSQSNLVCRLLLEKKKPHTIAWLLRPLPSAARNRTNLHVDFLPCSFLNPSLYR